MRLREWEFCTQWAKGNPPVEAETYSDFKIWAKSFMLANKSHASREIRRFCRIPLGIRELFRKSGCAIEESERQQLVTEARAKLKEHHLRHRPQALRGHQSKGKLLQRVDRLHRVQEMILSKEACGEELEGVVSSKRTLWKK